MRYKILISCNDNKNRSYFQCAKVQNKIKRRGIIVEKNSKRLGNKKQLTGKKRYYRYDSHKISQGRRKKRHDGGEGQNNAKKHLRSVESASPLRHIGRIGEDIAHEGIEAEASGIEGQGQPDEEQGRAKEGGGILRERAVADRGAKHYGALEDAEQEDHQSGGLLLVGCMVVVCVAMVTETAEEVLRKCFDDAAEVAYVEGDEDHHQEQQRHHPRIFADVVDARLWLDTVFPCRGHLCYGLYDFAKEGVGAVGVGNGIV